MQLPDVLDLSGKVAIVTGASQGIGRGVALCLARYGAGVTLAARNAANLEESAHLVREAGGQACVAVTDVTQADQVAAMVKSTLQHFGRVDVLVNNAGILELQPLMEMDEHTWRQVLNTNLTSMFLCCQQVGHHLIEQQQGAVINMASHWSLIGVSQAVAYAASKSGVTGFTRALAVEWARHNITVNAVAPGLTATEINAEARHDARMRDRILRQIPLRRFGDVEEVGHLVAYLSSDAARFITGQTIVMDGGQIIA
jgi:NAD(P)-dependent dehydrogenase (short-subunit alcohol dehydrogenase family)